MTKTFSHRELNVAADKLMAMPTAKPGEAGISFAHIDAGACLREEAAKLAASRAKATAAAASAWHVGAAILTRRGERGIITAIEGWNLVVEIDGAARKFAASMVKAA